MIEDLKKKIPLLVDCDYVIFLYFIIEMIDVSNINSSIQVQNLFEFLN